MAFKFEKLEVWQMALNYIDWVYEMADRLPDNEKFNLKSQITRAATSVALNIAEGSTGQTDPEQNRFLGLALRSLIEAIACQRITRRRKYLLNDPALDKIDTEAEALTIKIQSFRKSLGSSKYAVREEAILYEFDILEN
jgi:four helix bundle protein